MIVIPAIDIRGGRAVRLHQGDYDRETVFDADPVSAARRWREQGARRLHVVDLDGAREGRPVNVDVIASIVEEMSPVPVQVGGGLRTARDVDALLDAGARWVILGTAALEDAQLLTALCAAHRGQVLVGVDARDGRVAIRGWREQSEVDVLSLARRVEEAGAAGVIHTDIARDGTGHGPNLEATAEVAGAVSVPVIVSGGVGGVAHVEAAASRGLFGGVIVGRALYDGRLALPRAIAVAREAAGC